MRVGVQQLLIVLVIVIIIFGPTQIPKLTKMFGKSVKGFKEGMEEPEEVVEDAPKPKKKAQKAAAKVEADEEADEEYEKAGGLTRRQYERIRPPEGTAQSGFGLRDCLSGRLYGLPGHCPKIGDDIH